MSQITPAKVFREVTAAVPPDCRKNIVIIGSLAAGYHFFGDDPAKAVRTKDVDCVLEPFHHAVAAGQNIARELLDAGWQWRRKGTFRPPGDAHTPVNELPAVRLYPPDVDPESAGSWFLELLTVPDVVGGKADPWTRLPLREGHFGLPTFRALALTAFEPLPAGNLGIRYARPELMALSNLLEHPRIKAELMSEPFAGRQIKRSNKDLGRVLAIATLAGLPDYSPWVQSWQEALATQLPGRWQDAAQRTGDGLREVLASDGDLEQAQHTCVNGLLASVSPLIVTPDALRATGDRLLAEAIEPLEAVARG